MPKVSSNSKNSSIIHMQTKSAKSAGRETRNSQRAVELCAAADKLLIFAAFKWIKVHLNVIRIPLKGTTFFVISLIPYLLLFATALALGPGVTSSYSRYLAFSGDPLILFLIISSLDWFERRVKNPEKSMLLTSLIKTEKDWKHMKNLFELVPGLKFQITFGIVLAAILESIYFHMLGLFSHILISIIIHFLVFFMFFIFSNMLLAVILFLLGLKRLKKIKSFNFSIIPAETPGLVFAAEVVKEGVTRSYLIAGIIMVTQILRPYTTYRTGNWWASLLAVEILTFFILLGLLAYSLHFVQKLVIAEKKKIISELEVRINRLYRKMTNDKNFTPLELDAYLSIHQKIKESPNAPIRFVSLFKGIPYFFPYLLSMAGTIFKILKKDLLELLIQFFSNI